jgi:hypothetical protein
MKVPCDCCEKPFEIEHAFTLAFEEPAPPRNTGIDGTMSRTCSPMCAGAMAFKLWSMLHDQEGREDHAAWAEYAVLALARIYGMPPNAATMRNEATSLRAIADKIDQLASVAPGAAPEATPKATRPNDATNLALVLAAHDRHVILYRDADDAIESFFSDVWYGRFRDDSIINCTNADIQTPGLWKVSTYTSNTPMLYVAELFIEDDGPGDLPGAHEHSLVLRKPRLATADEWRAYQEGETVFRSYVKVCPRCGSEFAPDGSCARRAAWSCQGGLGEAITRTEWNKMKGWWRP